LADLQNKSNEVITTLLSLPHAEAANEEREEAISTADKAHFSQQLKIARNGLASIHQSLHATPEWYSKASEAAVTENSHAILDTVLAGVVWCRG
jgi:hypothetical protein